MHCVMNQEARPYHVSMWIDTLPYRATYTSKPIIRAIASPPQHLKSNKFEQIFGRSRSALSSARRTSKVCRSITALYSSILRRTLNGFRDHKPSLFHLTVSACAFSWLVVNPGVR